jgi:hypothetical protein
MVTGVFTLNSYIVNDTDVPAGPWEGNNDMDRGPDCARATGVIIAANVNMLRKSSTSIALLKLFSISIKHFCIAIVPLPC